jgi:hypothetical protein
LRQCLRQLAFTWDDEGKLLPPTSLTSDRRNNGIFDLAFHPSSDLVAIAEDGQPLQLCRIQNAGNAISIESTADLSPPPQPPPIPTRPDLLPPEFRNWLDKRNAEEAKTTHP